MGPTPLREYGIMERSLQSSGGKAEKIIENNSFKNVWLVLDSGECTVE